MAETWNVEGRTALLSKSCPTYAPVDTGGAGGPDSCDKIYSHVKEAQSNAEFGDLLKVFIVMLPIIAGFLGTVMTRNAFESKWKISYLSGLQICSEIFMYRSKVGTYRDVTAEEIQRASKDGKAAKEDERELFVNRIQDIFSEAMSTEVGKNGEAM